MFSIGIRIRWFALGAVCACALACSSKKDEASKADKPAPAQPGAASPGLGKVMAILGRAAPPSGPRKQGELMNGLFGGKMFPAAGPAGAHRRPTEPAGTAAPSDSPGTADDPAGTAGDPAGSADDPAPAADDPAGAVPPASAPLPPPAAAGGDCAAVAARVLAIAQAQVAAELDGVDAETRKQVEAMTAGMLGQLEGQVRTACESQSWPTQLRDCLLTAADLGALQGCEQYATDDMRRAAEAAAAAPPVAPPPPLGPSPTWPGGADDCDAVGTQVAALTRWQVSGAPAEQRQAIEPLLAELAGQVSAACTGGAWSDVTRQCLLRATSADALQTCGAGP